MYLEIWIIEFLYLVPLFLYLNQTKKVNYKLLTILIGISSLINFSFFHPYGFKFLIMIVVVNLIFYLTFIFLTKIFISKKYDTFLITGTYYLIFYSFQFFPFNNFWLNLSNFLANYPLTMQYLGSIITTYFVVLFNYITFKIILEIINFRKKDKKVMNDITKVKKIKEIIRRIRSNITYKNVINKIIIVVLIFNFFVFNTYFFNDRNEGENYDLNEQIKIAGIQTNLKQSWPDRRENKLENFNFYINQSKIAIQEYEPDIIVWPEYALTHSLEFDLDMIDELNYFANKNNITLIVGSIMLENKSSNNSKRYNSLYIFEGENNYANYHAYEPVTMFDSDIAKMKGDNKRIDVKNISLGLILCYEENFPYIFQKQIVENDASLFIVDGNQYFVANSHGQKLTSLNSNMRAFENNRFVFRIQTSGLSTVIDNYGRNVHSIENNEVNILFYNVPSINTKTFYSKYGQELEIGFCVILIIIYLILIKIKFMRKSSTQEL